MSAMKLQIVFNGAWLYCKTVKACANSHQNVVELLNIESGWQADSLLGVFNHAVFSHMCCSS